MKDTLPRMSRFLSLILRHDPKRLNLEMDQNAWVDVEELIKNWGIERVTLEEIVSTNNKNRYSFNDSKTKIRANQGHSVDVELELEVTVAPDIMYHGTASRFISSIIMSGIEKMKRHNVHISDNVELATVIGKRHGHPVVVVVDAKQMQLDGLKFYKSENDVWLCDDIEPKYFKEIMHVE